MAGQNLEAGLLLQERQGHHFPNHDHPQSLHLALERQDHPLHGQVSYPN